MLSSTGLVANQLNTAGTVTEKETAVTAEGVNVHNTTDRSKLTPQGLEMTDKEATTSPVKNVLNKSSITLTDTTGGAATKNDTNTITASSSTLANKAGDTTTVKADGIKVANGTQAVTITKNSVTGAETVGNDGTSKITFNKKATTGTAKDASAVITVDGKDLTITKDGANGADGISIQ